jgi:hypothetical protein
MQLVGTRHFSGQNTAEIARGVDALFGPRQDACGEAGYRMFVQQFSLFTKTAMRLKGAEQEGALIAAQEILKRWPLRVRWDGSQDRGALLHQLRSDLAVLSAEVGTTPPVQALLTTLASLQSPRPVPKTVTLDESALQIVVPEVPLPAWAVIALHEADEHLQRREVGTARNKIALVLEWLKLVGKGTPPADIHVVPAPATTGAPPAASRLPAR